MRKIRIYQPGVYQSGDCFELSAEAGQHVGVVLRKQPGDQIVLFSGDDREFDAVIMQVHKKRVEIKITAVREQSCESPRAIHLAQAISKGERMEFVIQKAVELGVRSICPVITGRSVVKLDKERMEKKQAQWQAIAIAACEQSGRNFVPSVYSPLGLSAYLETCGQTMNFVLDPRGAKTWRDYDFASNELGLLIGPEGGFSDEELNQIITAGFHPLCLGPRVLRTETAAITALGVLQAVCGDL